MAPVVLTPADREVLRRLVAEQAEIAALPVQKEKAALWRRLNDLDSVRPMVWINEIPWHEMDVDGELTLRCGQPWARELEQTLRRTLYQWRHLPADMVVDAFVACPWAIHSTGFGLAEDVDIARTDDANEIYSRHFHRQIVEPEDVGKIRMPEVTCDREDSEARFAAMVDAFGDILPVRMVGKKGTWFAPWDELIRWWGVEEALRDLVDRPEMVRAAISRLVDAYLCELDQWVALGLLTRNNDNTRIGSGGYGYVSDLPEGDAAPAHMWGNATAQIFGSVSGRMHWEFALRDEMRWLERWGLTYYGCCEPLDIKMGLMRRIPNLRKISMSPWVNVDRAVREVGDGYVFSRKPSPAVMAGDAWIPEAAAADLRDFLGRARGCHIELIMKDISTVRYEPQRLWEWEKIAMRAVEEWRA
jgi:hypothetical protein